MKSRKLGIALLLLLAMVVTTGSFAYWASGVTVTQGSQTPTVTIGSGDSVATTVTIDPAGYTLGQLVPLGHENGVDKFNTITFDMTVNWDGDALNTDADGTAGTLAITVGEFTFPSVAYTEANVMFDVTESYPNGNGISVGGTLVITITVYFAVEPANQAEYDNVAGQNLSIPLTFTVTETP